MTKTESPGLGLYTAKKWCLTCLHFTLPSIFGAHLKNLKTISKTYTLGTDFEKLPKTESPGLGIYTEKMVSHLSSLSITTGPALLVLHWLNQ